MPTAVTLEYEQKLIQVVRKLPPERAFEVLDFARFLEFQISHNRDDEPMDEDASEEDIAAENARWDALLATDESQRLLEKIADDAWAAIQAGQSKPMVFTEDGDIVPA
jgi:hypothetical protein